MINDQFTKYLLAHFKIQNVPLVVIPFSIKGQTLSSLADLDKYLLGHHGGLLKPIRPVSAYVVGSADSRNADEKPVLRRERTWRKSFQIISQETII